MEELEEPNADTDFDAVWDSLLGYEDELLRMEQAWAEFEVAARDYDHDIAAEDEFDVISEGLDLDRPEILLYLSTECTG